MSGKSNSGLLLEVKTSGGRSFEFTVTNASKNNLLLNTAQIVNITKPGTHHPEIITMIGLPFKDPTGPSGDFVHLTHLKAGEKLSVKWIAPAAVKGKVQSRSSAWTPEGRKKDTSLVHPDVTSAILELEIK